MSEPGEGSAGGDAARDPTKAPQRRRRLVTGSALFGVVLLLMYLLLWPVPIDPAPWTPAPAPTLEGPFAANQRLASLEVLPTDGAGPEDVAIDAAGYVYAGLEDGKIIRLPPHGGASELVVDTGGRPLGLDFDGAGQLIVADAVKGLLSVDPRSGELQVLSSEHGGRPYLITDDVDVGPDGVMYFTDASSRFPLKTYRLDLLENRGWGRLLAYDPRSGETRLLLDDLHFANGVAVSPGGEYLLVVETGRYRVLRYWLRGPRRGEHEELIANLPGWPDGISTGTGGIFWLALVSPRDPFLDEQLFPRPFLRKVLLRLPEAFMPAPRRFGFVLGIDGEGRIRHNLQDPAATGFSPISSVEEAGGQLYLGSLTYRGIGRLPVPKGP